MSSRACSTILAPFITTVALLSGCSSFNPDEQIPTILSERRTTDVDNAVVDQLDRNRIVMLADQGHFHWAFKQGVIDVLDAWFDRVTTDSTAASRLRSLTLVLEADSSKIEKVYRYMGSGRFADIFEVGMLASQDERLSHLEFYWRLGKLMRRIDDFNAAHPGPEQILLTLFGAEPEIDIAQWSFEKKDRYFLYQRDSLVANNVQRYIEDHPGDPILAFYGSAHLQRGIVTKRTETDSVQGRFLAAYLDEKYPGQVLTVGQVTPAYWSVKGNMFGFGDTAYAVVTHDSDTRIQDFLAGPLKFDMVIVRSDYGELAPAVANIPSLNMVRLAIPILPAIIDPSNEYYTMDWKGLLVYFDAVTGAMPHRVNLTDAASLRNESRLWREWSTQGDSNIVPDLVTLRLYTRLCDTLAIAGRAAPVITWEVKRLLPDAPGPMSGDRVSTPAAYADEIRDYITANRDDLITNALIGILWVGNDAERASARKALVDMTGETYADPADWSAWWRQQ